MTINPERIHLATAAEIEEILVKNTGVDPDVLADQRTTPLEQLGLDSLAVLELQAVAADRFGVEVPDDALTMSVLEIVNFINAELTKGE